MPAKKVKMDKDAMIYQAIEKLYVTSENWKTLLESSSWEERVFLLKKKKDIDRMLADYKNLTS